MKELSGCLRGEAGLEAASCAQLEDALLNSLVQKAIDQRELLCRGLSSWGGLFEGADGAFYPGLEHPVAQLPLLALDIALERGRALCFAIFFFLFRSCHRRHTLQNYELGIGVYPDCVERVKCVPSVS